MSGTVMDNIRLGKPDATDDDVMHAARAASAHDFILRLPKGYGYEVGPNGTALSSGQRQRVALARAFLRDPAILILDEAMSNLDSETERAVLEALRAKRRRRTTIIVTHRLATAQQAERILVMSKGRVVEDGAQDTLIERRGHYERMWRAVAVSTGVTPLPDNMEEIA